MNHETASKDDTVPLLSAREGCEVGCRSVTDVESLPEIISTAREAQAKWGAVSLGMRSRGLMSVVRHLHRYSDDYSERLSRLNGKPSIEAMVGEIYPTLSTFRYFARKGPAALKPRRVPIGAVPMAYSRLAFDPLGVIGVISPWNYPFKLMLQDVPAALISGNAVIIKVSEHATAVGDLAEELLRDSELPQGLVQFIFGYGELGAKLVSSGIDKVSFTGSSATGRSVYEAAAKAMIPATLEMGGKDAAIILEDADLDDAARGILWGALTNCGQACASIESIYCPVSLRDDFSKHLTSLLESLPNGSLGTMNTVFQKEKVFAQVKEAVDRGATIVAQRKSSVSNNPYSIDAVFIDDVAEDSPLRCEETFGPVILVHSYKDLDDVIDEVNSGSYGLTASIWSKDRANARKLATRIDTGIVTINDHLITPGLPEAPWFGRKASGLGLSMSTHSLMGFSRLRYVYDDRGLVKYKFWRYPYDKTKKAWLKVFLSGQISENPITRFIGFLRSMPAMLFRRNLRWEDKD